MTVTQENEISYKFYESIIGRLEPKTKAQWVAALRSGKYPQGMKMLQTPEGGFCCLGVYCEVTGIPSAMKDRKIEEIVDSPSGPVEIDVVKSVRVYGTEGDELGGSFLALPSGYRPSLTNPGEEMSKDQHAFKGTEIVFETRMQGPDQEPYFSFYENFTLPGLNDSGQFNFNQIADIIDYFL